jgi:hypothetical protein
MPTYPGAIQRHSEINHPSRSETRGIVIHWTAGHKAGDLEALDGPLVDCHFYVDKDGEVYQLLDSGSQAWHAMHTANHTCVGIEHESFGEAYTPKQFEASAKLAAWVSKLYNIPIVHVDPPANWHGFFGHGDLAGFESNDHTDSVPTGTGWDRYLTRVRGYADGGAVNGEPDRPPNAESLRVMLQPKGSPQKVWKGWDDGSWALRWIASHGIKPDTKAIVAWQGNRYRGPVEATKMAKKLVHDFL